MKTKEIEKKASGSPRSVEEVRAWLRNLRDRQIAWQEKVRHDYVQLQMEVEHAKEDPFYQRGSSGVACEPAPVPKPMFKPGSFVAAIRKQRFHQQQWQERINRNLDDMEEQRRICQEQFQFETK